MGDLPLLTVDMDGVICRPFLPSNPGIHLTFLDAGAPPPAARVYPRWLNAPLDHLRFDFRRPLPGALEAVRELSRVRRLVLLTGRRTHPQRWLGRHGFHGLFDEVVVNASRMSSPHYKLEAVRQLGANEHIDDDPRTAQLLAEASDVRVYLSDWPRSRDLVMHPDVVRVPGITGLARLLAGDTRPLEGAPLDEPGSTG